MEYVILVRHPNGTVVPLTTDDGESIEVFPSYEAAEVLADNHRFCQAFGYQCVELEI